MHDGCELDGLGAGADDDQDAVLLRHWLAGLSDHGLGFTRRADRFRVGSFAVLMPVGRGYPGGWTGSTSTVVGRPSMLNTCIVVVAVKRITFGAWCSRSMSPLSCSVSSIGDSA